MIVTMGKQKVLKIVDGINNRGTLYLVNSPLMDNIKATISSLSLLHSCDFVEIVKKYSIETLKSCLNIIIEDEEFKVFDEEKETLYFDDVLRGHEKN